MKLLSRDLVELVCAFALGIFCAWAYMQKTVAIAAYEDGYSHGVSRGMTAHHQRLQNPTHSEQVTE